MSRTRQVVLGLAAVSGVAGAVVTVRALRGGDHARRESVVAKADDAGAEGALAMGTPRQRTELGGCVYSPSFLDDDTAVFDVTLPGRDPDVYTYQLSSSELRKITDAPTWEWRATRGLDSSEMIYLVTDMQKSGQSYVAARDRKTNVERRLAAGTATATTATSDSYYYLRTDGHEVRRVRGNLDEQVVELTELARAQAMSASRDGRRLAVVGRLPDAHAGICFVDVAARTLACPPHHDYLGPSRVDFGLADDLYVASTDGIRAYPPEGVDRMVLPGVRAYGGLAVAPNGKRLAYSDCTAIGAIEDVGVTRVALTDADKLSEPIAGPGGWTAWLRNKREVFARAPDGAIRDLIGPGKPGSALAFPAFDNTGKQLAFGRTGNAPGIWVVDTDHAAPPRQVTFGEHDFMPVFLRDGSIAFAREYEKALHIFRVMPGAEPTRVSTRPRQIMDVDRKTGRVLLRSTDQKFLYWWDPVTGKEVAGPPTYIEGTEHTPNIAISPDGNWMIYQSGPLGATAWRTPTTTWKPEQVFSASPDATLEYVSITDEGHPLVIEKVWHGELYTVDAVRGSL